MRPFLIPLVLVLLFAPASAEACVPSTSEPEIDTLGIVGPRYYVDNDVIVLGFSIWFYEESNGMDGLQRGDEVVDDTCGGMIEADTIIS